MIDEKFDKFQIEQFPEGWMIQVGKSRPINAPRIKRTDADRERGRICKEKNMELLETMFTFEEMMSEINKLSYE